MIDNRRKSVDAYMPLWIGDYLADTPHLTTEQHGAYLLLLMAYWRKGGPLPADEPTLARIAKMTTHKWKATRPVMVALFVEEGGVWRSKRADAELEKANALKAARSASGKRGAEVSNAKRAGKITYVAPHAVNERGEKSLGGFEVKAFEILEGGLGTKSAELSHINSGGVDVLPSAKPQPSPSPSSKEENCSSSETLGSMEREGVASDPRPPSFGKKPSKKKPNGIEPGIPTDDVGAIVDYWNGLAEHVGLPQVRMVTATRRQKVQARINELGGVVNLGSVIDKIEHQPFLLGKNKRNWQATFDWVMEPSNLAKVAENTYANTGGANGHA